MKVIGLVSVLLLISDPVRAQLPNAPVMAGSVSAESPVTQEEYGAVSSVVPSVEPPACEGTCVSDDDMVKFLIILRQRKCLNEQTPVFDLDPINIVIDKDGRVFFSGADPHPYTLRMSWCDFQVTARGRVNVIAAVQEPPVWGFRFRPKAYIGTLPLEAIYSLPEGQSRELSDVMDAGLMVDFLYYRWANLNAAVGYHSLGGGVGMDLTSNFGAYAGYALTWGKWHHNINLGLWFSFWNP